MPIVNYVREHVQFIEYATDEMLSSSERLLWYGLMDIMNSRAQGNIWPDEFIRIDNNRLCSKAGIKYDALVEARNKLKQRGLIDYMPGERNRKNPTYKMNYFYPQYVKPETEEDGERTEPGGQRKECYPVKPEYFPGKNTGYPEKPDKNPCYNPCYNPSNSPGKNPCKTPNSNTKPYSKGLTEPKNGMEDDDDGEDESARSVRDRLIRCYKNCFGKKASPAEITKIVRFCNLTGMPENMAAMAMRSAAEHGPSDAVAYTLTILADWKVHHVFQEYQAEAYQYHQKNSTGDVVEDYRRKQEAMEEWRRENIEAGLERETEGANR